MSVSDRKTEPGSLEIMNNLETMFSGAFLQDDDDDAVDEGNYFTSTVKSEKGSRTICFRKEILTLPIIKSVIGGGRGRPKGSLNKPKNDLLTGVPKKPKIFSNWLECKHCEYKCRKRKPLQNHMLEEHNEIIYLCEHCDEMFRDKSELQEHERGIHGGIKYPCPEENCNYATPDIRDLEEHIEIHLDYIVPCDLCEFKAQSIRKLNCHMEEVHAGPECKFYCSFCEFTALKKEEVKIHQDVMHKNHYASCSRCDFTTSKPKLLKCHEETFHKTVEYKCTQCDFKCKWESSLRQHAEQHHGGKDFKCEQCDFRCRWKTALNKHMRDKHSELGSTTQCSFCGVEFPCRRDLKRHIRENHEAPQEFKCQYCGKNFPKKPNLKIHERIHTGEKPYKCETCGHAFTAASNLYHHKKKHTNESCAAKAAIKQESKSASVHGIYEQGYLPQPSYRTSDDLSVAADGVSGVGLGVGTMSGHAGSHMDSPSESHLDPRVEGLMDTKTEAGAGQTPGYHDQASYLSNFSQYYTGGYPQSPASNNSKMQNSMFEQYMDTGSEHYRYCQRSTLSFF